MRVPRFRNPWWTFLYGIRRKHHRWTRRPPSFPTPMRVKLLWWSLPIFICRRLVLFHVLALHKTSAPPRKPDTNKPPNSATPDLWERIVDDAPKWERKHLHNS